MSEQVVTIPAETAARLIKVDVRHLQRLVKDGWIKKTADGKYTVIGTVHGFIDYKNDETRRNSSASSGSLAQQARAKEIELRIAQRQGELMEATEAFAVLDEIVGVFRNAVEGIPAAATRDRDLRASVTKATNAALEQVTDALRQRLGAFGASAAAARSQPANNARRVGAKKSALPKERRRTGAARTKSDAIRGAN